MTITSNQVFPRLDKPDLDQRPGSSDVTWAERAYHHPQWERGNRRASAQGAPRTPTPVAASRCDARSCLPNGRARCGDKVRGFVAFAGHTPTNFIADRDNSTTNCPPAFQVHTSAASSIPVTVPTIGSPKP